MHKIATTLRTAQLYAHEAHNQSSGSGFFGDHQFFNDAYKAYEDAYDLVVERMIGLGICVDHKQLSEQAVDQFPTSHDYYERLMELEAQLQREIDEELPEATTGTNNLLSGLADASEVRVYKMKQRTE